SRSASSFSGGSRSPGPSSPEMIIALIFWIASSVTAMATSSHIGRMSAVGVCDDGGMRVLDAHLHLWDPAVLEYDWLEGPLARRFAEEEFAEEQLIGVEEEAAIFVQAGSADEQQLDEVRWVDSIDLSTGVVAIVAGARLDLGAETDAHLAALAEHERVVGVRHLLQGEVDGFA